MRKNTRFRRRFHASRLAVHDVLLHDIAFYVHSPTRPGRQYHKSNSALDLMIGELRLKVDGMQKELHTQNQRLEEGARFAEHFHNDVRAAVQVCTSI